MYDKKYIIEDLEDEKFMDEVEYVIRNLEIVADHLCFCGNKVKIINIDILSNDLKYTSVNVLTADRKRIVSFEVEFISLDGFYKKNKKEIDYETYADYVTEIVKKVVKTIHTV